MSKKYQQFCFIITEKEKVYEGSGWFWKSREIYILCQTRYVTAIDRGFIRFQIPSKLIVKLSALEYHVTQEKGTEWAWEWLEKSNTDENIEVQCNSFLKKWRKVFNH